MGLKKLSVLHRYLVLLLGIGVVFLGARVYAQEQTPSSVVFASFQSNRPELVEQAAAIRVLVASRLAQRPGARIVAVEDLLNAMASAHPPFDPSGAGDLTRIFEMASALHVEHLVHGRIDQFGKRYVLSAIVVQVSTIQVIAHLRVDAAAENNLLEAGERLGDGVAEALGLVKASAIAPVEVIETVPLDEADFLLAPKLGYSLTALEGFSFNTPSLRFDLEADFTLMPNLFAYLEVGVVMGRAKSDATQEEGSFSVVPAGAGLKYWFLPGKKFRYYLGAGVGLGFFTDLIESSRKVGFRVHGVAGIAWLPWERLGICSEIGAEVDTRLYYGISTHLGAIVAF